MAGRMPDFDCMISQVEFHSVLQGNGGFRSWVKLANPEKWSSAKGAPERLIFWMESHLNGMIEQVRNLCCATKMIKVSVSEPQICDLPIKIMGRLHDPFSFSTWIDDDGYF